MKYIFGFLFFAFSFGIFYKTLEALSAKGIYDPLSKNIFLDKTWDRLYGAVVHETAHLILGWDEMVPYAFEYLTVYEDSGQWPDSSEFEGLETMPLGPLRMCENRKGLILAKHAWVEGDKEGNPQGAWNYLRRVAEGKIKIKITELSELKFQDNASEDLHSLWVFVPLVWTVFGAMVKKEKDFDFAQEQQHLDHLLNLTLGNLIAGLPDEIKPQYAQIKDGLVIWIARNSEDFKAEYVSIFNLGQERPGFWQRAPPEYRREINRLIKEYQNLFRRRANGGKSRQLIPFNLLARQILKNYITPQEKKTESLRILSEIREAQSALIRLSLAAPQWLEEFRRQTYEKEIRLYFTPESIAAGDFNKFVPIKESEIDDKEWQEIREAHQMIREVSQYLTNESQRQEILLKYQEGLKEKEHFVQDGINLLPLLASRYAGESILAPHFANNESPAVKKIAEKVKRTFRIPRWLRIFFHRRVLAAAFFLFLTWVPFSYTINWQELLARKKSEQTQQVEEQQKQEERTQVNAPFMLSAKSKLDEQLQGKVADLHSTEGVFDSKILNVSYKRQQFENDLHTLGSLKTQEEKIHFYFMRLVPQFFYMIALEKSPNVERLSQEFKEAVFKARFLWREAELPEIYSGSDVFNRGVVPSDRYIQPLLDLAASYRKGKTIDAASLNRFRNSDVSLVSDGSNTRNNNFYYQFFIVPRGGKITVDHSDQTKKLFKPLIVAVPFWAKDTFPDLLEVNNVLRHEFPTLKNNLQENPPAVFKKVQEAYVYEENGQRKLKEDIVFTKISADAYSVTQDTSFAPASLRNKLIINRDVQLKREVIGYVDKDLKTPAGIVLTDRINPDQAANWITSYLQSGVINTKENYPASSDKIKTILENQTAAHEKRHTYD
ncbi:MAG TPA: hypothetical protein VJA17_01695, partial [Candidatus Omnitrophota bacterium]|nr:hypothetical protein [Candidatus Omnitrophota bacterium]